MLGRRSSPIQMGFPTLRVVYTAEEGNLELGNIFIQHFPARRHLSMKNLIQMEMRLRNRSFDRAFVKSNTIWISGNIAYFQYSANRMYTIYSSIQLSKQNSSNRNKIEDNWKSTFEEIRTSRNSKIFLYCSTISHRDCSTGKRFFKPPLTRPETGALSTGGGNFIFPASICRERERQDSARFRSPPSFRLKAFLPSLPLPLSG